MVAEMKPPGDDNLNLGVMVDTLYLSNTICSVEYNTPDMVPSFGVPDLFQAI